MSSVVPAHTSGVGFCCRAIGTLLQSHETIRALFGWSGAYPHQFLIRGKSFQANRSDAGNQAGAMLLSDFQFYLRERFFDYRFDLQTPV